MAKKIRRLQKNVKQTDGSFITEHYETDATIVEYDSTNSGLECDNAQEAIDELAKQQKVIEGNIVSETTYERKELTIPIEGWTDAAIGQYAKKVSIPVLDLKITDIIEGEVTLDTEQYAQECKLAYQCECEENSVTFFASAIPTSSIKINYYILQGKDGNASLGKIVYTSSEVVDGFESDSVTKSGSAKNDMLLHEEVNNNKEDIADLVKQLTEINTKLASLGTTDTSLQTQISELNKNINGNTYLLRDGKPLANIDLNDIKEIGNYYCPSNNFAGTVINVPITNTSFTLKVYSATGLATDYLLQELTTYTGIKFIRKYTPNQVWSEWDRIVINSDLKRHFYRYDGSNKEFAIQDIFYKLPTDNDIHFVMMDCMNLVCLIVQKYGSHSYGSVLSFGYGDRLTQYRIDMDKWYKSNINFSESQIDKLV